MNRVSDEALVAAIKRYGNNKAGDIYLMLTELQRRRATRTHRCPHCVCKIEDVISREKADVNAMLAELPSTVSKKHQP